VININQQLPLTIVPKSPSRMIEFTVDVSESDSGAPFGGGDDHIRPSTVLTNNQLKVGRVDNLFGPLRSSMMLKPKS
jgi:hypothetical protein